MKLTLLLLLLAVLASLAAALVALFKSGRGSRRMAHALTIRVALSIAFFLLLLLAWQLGLIQPHGLGG